MTAVPRDVRESVGELVERMRRELISSTSLTRIERAQIAIDLAETTKLFLAMEEEAEGEGGD